MNDVEVIIAAIDAENDARRALLDSAVAGGSRTVEQAEKRHAGREARFQSMRDTVLQMNDRGEHDSLRRFAVKPRSFIDWMDQKRAG